MEGSFIPPCTCGRSWCQCPTRKWDLDWDKCNRSFELCLPGGATFEVAVSDDGVRRALQRLLSDTRDRVLSIDLEWRPDYTVGSNNLVSVISIAGAKSVVLILTSLRGFTLPNSLLHVINDPSITWIGQGWGVNDERKFKSTFGFGCKSFAGTFLDLQNIAVEHGMPKGLKDLAMQVLGVQGSKSTSRRLTMSDWEAEELSKDQMVYAAMDSLMPAAIYRMLRYRHSA